MSTRSQVKVIQVIDEDETKKKKDRDKDEVVWLYRHYDGYFTPDRVRKALARKERWTDPSYLTRIIFCEMMDMDFKTMKNSAGFGITSVGPQGDIQYLVTVNIPKQTVGINYGFGLSENEFKQEWTFKEFIEDNFPEDYNEIAYKGEE